MLRSILTVGVMMVLASVAGAADTLEVWDAGTGNFEMYSGFGGVGATTAEQSIGSSMLLGWGVARGFSAYVSTALSADGNFDQTETELDLGAFGTVLDTDHLDLDLGLDMVAYGPGMSRMAVVPAFEVNLDHGPDLVSYGGFVRGAARMAGREVGGDEVRRHTDFNLTLGTYLTLSPRRQLVLEYDMTFHNKPEPGTPRVQRGAVALGYNVLLSQRLELISEARFQVPQEDRDGDLGLLVGVIAALE